MTRDPYTEHMDEMLRLGGAHECASDCPMPLPRRRPDSRASAPESNLYDRIAASAEGSPHAEPYKLSAPEQGEPPALREALIDALIDAEADDMIGPFYTPDDLSTYLAEHVKVRAASGAQAVLPLDVERLMVEHRECGTPNGYDGCYAHFPMPHCRADGMTWPCDVGAIRAAFHPEDGPQKHAAWCYLPADHEGLCEGDQ